MMQILLAILILAIALIAGAAFLFFRHPLDLVIFAQRRALRRAGLRRHVMHAPRGRLVYWKGGSGPVTFLLHGVNDQAGSWSGIVPMLLHDMTLVIPDFPGHGESDPRGGPLSLDDIRPSLESLIAKEAYEGRMRLVGNSMGGWVALAIALEYPERVASLVLESPGGARFDYDAALFLPKSREEASKIVRDVYGPDLPMPAGFVLDHMIRRAPRMPAARIFERDINEEALDDRLGAITAPVTLLWGEYDAVLPPDYGRKLQSMIPGARLEIIPRAAHIAHRTHPKQFAAAVLRAFESHPGA
ncbi:MAG: alpha/beta fold hydrolase [Thermoanaerobaculia bacterium]